MGYIYGSFGTKKETMTQIKRSAVLVTGGASGIGKLLATRCLERGASKAILWDIDEGQLLKTAEELTARGFVVHAYQVDVSDVEQIAATAAETLADVGRVDILINNAGIVVGKSFAEHTHRDIDRTVDINVSGVMHTTLSFLPHFLERKTGHIVNIASAAGLIANPNMSVYAGSKWAVIGWSDSLRLEMEATAPKVRVTTVMPSYINTGMFDGVSAPLLTPIMEPEYIVEKIMNAIEKNIIMLQEPAMVKAIPILKGLLPQRVFDYVAGDVFGVYKTMDTFKGKAGKPKAEQPK